MSSSSSLLKRLWWLRWTDSWFLILPAGIGRWNICLGNLHFFWHIPVEIQGRKVKFDRKHKSIQPPISSYYESSDAAILTTHGGSCMNVFNLHKSSQNYNFTLCHCAFKYQTRFPSSFCSTALFPTGRTHPDPDQFMHKHVRTHSHKHVYYISVVWSIWLQIVHITSVPLQQPVCHQQGTTCRDSDLHQF